jgi:hypothetical protein
MKESEEVCVNFVLHGQWSFHLFFNIFYNVINKNRDNERLWKTKLLKTYDVASVILTTAMKEVLFKLQKIWQTQSLFSSFPFRK